jgi:hypothetical protein
LRALLHFFRGLPYKALPERLRLKDDRRRREGSKSDALGFPIQFRRGGFATHVNVSQQVSAPPKLGDETDPRNNEGLV